MTTFNIGVAIDGYSITENTEDGPVERWVEVFCVVATADTGHVWCLADSHTHERGLAELDVRTLDHDPATKPEAWMECEPTYGSEAWDAEAEYRLACFEADAFNEPRPRW